MLRALIITTVGKFIQQDDWFIKDLPFWLVAHDIKSDLTHYDDDYEDLLEQNHYDFILFDTANIQASDAQINAVLKNDYLIPAIGFGAQRKGRAEQTLNFLANRFNMLPAQTSAENNYDTGEMYHINQGLGPLKVAKIAKGIYEKSFGPHAEIEPEEPDEPEGGTPPLPAK